jgi:hypothetical protein
MEPWTQMRCPLHPDGRASRLRWGTGQRWTCFHCGETFATPGAAADHFGATPDRVAGCLIDRVALEEGGKPERGRGLLMALRQAEASLAAQAQRQDELVAENEDLRRKVANAAFNCPSCGRHDFGLFVELRTELATQAQEIEALRLKLRLYENGTSPNQPLVDDIERFRRWKADAAMKERDDWKARFDALLRRLPERIEVSQ